MKYFIILFIFFFFLPEGWGQYTPKTKKKEFYGNSRLQKPLFRWVTGDYSKHGVQVNFGPTYTITSFREQEGKLSVHSPLATNASMEYSLKPEGKLGVFAELGMVHITRRPRKIIHYYDWSLGFKLYGGKEYAQTSLFNDRDSLIGKWNGQGDFYNGYLYGRFAVHNVFQIDKHLFLDNSLGFSLDYMTMIGDQTYEGYRPPVAQKFQEDFSVQLNYALGLGIKPDIDKGFFIIPSIEVPFLGVQEWNGGTPQVHWFSSKYYPLSVKVRLVWLFKKDPNRCPPVEINNDDRERAREYQNR